MTRRPALYIGIRDMEKTFRQMKEALKRVDFVIGCAMHARQIVKKPEL